MIFDVIPEKRLQLAEGSDDSEQFFVMKYFLIKVSILFSFFFKGLPLLHTYETTVQCATFLCSYF